MIAGCAARRRRSQPTRPAPAEPAHRVRPPRRRSSHRPQRLPLPRPLHRRQLNRVPRQRRNRSQACHSAGTAAAQSAPTDQELLSGIGGGTEPQMIGDMSPFTTMQRILATQQQPTLPQPFPPGKLPKPPSPRVASSLAPSARGFKIGENQSPMPQDRVYFTFDYFNNLNAALNKRFEAPVDNLRAYRYIFGLEKTFDEGRGSIGIQLPLDTLTADSTIQGTFAKPGGTSTALNDLTIYTKYILKRNPETGSLISAGLAVTPTTGPSTFAGASYLAAVHDTTVQPFIGYLWRRGDFYLHGFTAIDVPTSIRDVTMVYNDVGIGYYVYREP